MTGAPPGDERTFYGRSVSRTEGRPAREVRDGRRPRRQKVYTYYGARFSFEVPWGRPRRAAAVGVVGGATVRVGGGATGRSNVPGRAAGSPPLPDSS